MERFYDSKRADLREKILSTGNTTDDIHEAFLKYVGNTPPK